jgi:phosphatidylserine decarboxylase
MVRDGYYYGLAALVVAVLVGYFVHPAVAVVPVLLGAFFLWFFRDPERKIPTEPGAIVSPADGKVTSVAETIVNGRPQTRISIFLNVFNVHVNRTPIGGVIRSVEYRKGKFHNAMGAGTSDDNEQNIVAVEGEGQTVVFKQIAGLLARRIVFNHKVGDTVVRGQRIGLIKFGSRCDVIFDTSAVVKVKVGDKVAGGSSVLAFAPVSAPTISTQTVRTGDRA